MTNSTWEVCLFNAHRQLKGLNFFDSAREEKLGERIAKYPKEDTLSFLGRTINLLNTVSVFFSINAVAIYNQKYQVIHTRQQEYQ